MSSETLRKILWADVFGSGASVLFSIAAAGLVADWLEVWVWIPLAVGITLVPWVWFLYRTVRHDPLQTGTIAVIAAGNVGWAVAAAILILGFPAALSTAGAWIVGVFSLAVLDFGIAQWIGLSSVRRARQGVGSRMPA